MSPSLQGGREQDMVGTWKCHKDLEGGGEGRAKRQAESSTGNGDAIGAKPPQGLAGQAAGRGLCFWTLGNHGRASGQGATWLGCAWERAIT